MIKKIFWTCGFCNTEIGNKPMLLKHIFREHGKQFDEMIGTKREEMVFHEKKNK